MPYTGKELVWAIRREVDNHRRALIAIWGQPLPKEQGKELDEFERLAEAAIKSIEESK